MLWVVLLLLVGCTLAPSERPNLNVPVPATPVPSAEEQLSNLDPNDGKDEAVLILGTDDDLFEGRVNMRNYYATCLVMWAAEVDKHIDGDFVLFLSHGASIQDTWVCEYGPPYFYTVQGVVEDIRKDLGPRNSETPIILIVCNPWQFTISDDPNVFYGDANIFLWPDSALEEGQNDSRRNNLLCGEVVIGKFDNLLSTNNLQ